MLMFTLLLIHVLFAIGFCNIKVFNHRINDNMIIRSVLPVSAELSSKDQVYNNPGVDKLNSLMQEMCGSYDQVIYLDVAHSVSVDGVLPEDAGIDGKHCNKKYCLKMMDYIRKNVYVRR